jgi:4-oxalocrotonate tautomerase
VPLDKLVIVSFEGRHNFVARRGGWGFHFLRDTRPGEVGLGGERAQNNPLTVESERAHRQGIDRWRKHMPLVRIDLPASETVDYAKSVADAVYTTMVEVLRVPERDNFQVIAQHTPDTLIIDPHYLGIERSPRALVIDITLSEEPFRDANLKKAFYRRLTDALRDKVGVRPDDVVIGLTDVKKENWSFGNGEAPYA